MDGFLPWRKPRIRFEHLSRKSIYHGSEQFTTIQDGILQRWPMAGFQTIIRLFLRWMSSTGWWLCAIQVGQKSFVTTSVNWHLRLLLCGQQRGLYFKTSWQILQFRKKVEYSYLISRNYPLKNQRKITCGKFTNTCCPYRFVLGSTGDLWPQKWCSKGIIQTGIVMHFGRECLGFGSTHPRLLPHQSTLK